MVDGDDVVDGAAAAALLVEDVVGATTSEADCEVVDVDVEVVSTMTALLEVVGPCTIGTVGAAGKDGELDTTGEGTVPLLFAIVGACFCRLGGLFLDER